MATLPVSVDEIIAKWGPHKHYMTKESARARASQTADEFVKTHCCFCGLQCGIKLKVKDKKVVGPVACLSLFTSAAVIFAIFINVYPLPSPPPRGGRSR